MLNELLIFQRALPRDVLNIFAKHPFRIVKTEPADFLDMEYDVGSGVSLELVAQNLNVLLNIPRLYDSSKNEYIKDPTRSFVVVVLLGWFAAFGVPPTEFVSKPPFFM
jgi:hypothetical protein